MNTTPSTPQNYALFSKIIHWVTALIMAALLTVGYLMSEMDGTPAKFQMMALHKSFGILVLGLVLIRIASYIILKKPKSLPTHKFWEKFLAHAAHAFLYVAMLCLPLSGWIMSSAGDYPVPFFGLFNLPSLVAKNQDLFHQSEEVHETFAFLVFLVIGLHVLGAFKHHFLDKDETLKRMTSKKFGFVGGVVVLLLTAGAFSYPTFHIAEKILLGEEEEGEEYEKAAPAAAHMDEDGDEMEEHGENEMIAPVEGSWIIDSAQSAMTLKIIKYSKDIELRFPNFGGTIIFDSNDLANAKADISIDIESLTTGNSEDDNYARSSDWFNAKEYPKATFVSSSVTKAEGENAYTMTGTLNLHGVEKEITLPFTLNFNDGEDGKKIAHATANLSFNRMDYEIGKGENESETTIAHNVDLTLHIVATK